MSKHTAQKYTIGIKFSEYAQNQIDLYKNHILSAKICKKITPPNALTLINIYTFKLDAVYHHINISRYFKTCLVWTEGILTSEEPE